MQKSFLRATILACGIVVAGQALAQGRLIGVDSSRALYEIDMGTAVKTQIGTVSANASTTAGLAVGAGGTVYLTSSGNDSLYTVDLLTGNATLVGAYGDSAIVMHGLEYVGATNTLYGMSSHNGGLYTINQGTGVATLVGTTGLTSFHNLGYNSSTGVMYMTNSSTDSSYIIDLATANVTFLSGLGDPTNPNGMAFNNDNGNLYMIDNNTDDLYTINMGSGIATSIGDMGSGNLLGLAYVADPIPEPATMAILGLGAIATLRRRRQK